MEKNNEDKLAFKKRSNVIYFEVGAYYLIIAFALAMVLFLTAVPFQLWHLPVYLLPVFIIGWCQFSLSNALHEGLHKNFGKEHSEFWTALLTAYPIGFSMNYRHTHLEHHKYFGDKDKDPDYTGYCNFPKSKKEFIFRLLYNISGIAAIKQFFKENTSGNASADDEKKDSYVLLKLTCVQLVIMSLFFIAFLHVHVLAGLFAYGLFWILPLVTVAKFCSSTRLLCEHGTPKKKLVYRTITGSFFQTNSLGAFKFNYHGEHHIKPYIPYTKLKEAKQTMNLTIKNKDIAYEEYNYGYLALLLKWFRELPLT